jgi:hypothetical protein
MASYVSLSSSWELEISERLPVEKGAGSLLVDSSREESTTYATYTRCCCCSRFGSPKQNPALVTCLFVLPEVE